MPAPRVLAQAAVAGSLALAGVLPAAAQEHLPAIAAGQSTACGAVVPVLAGAAEKKGASTIRARQGASFRLVFKSQLKTCKGTVLVKEGERTMGKARFEEGRAVFRFPRDLAYGKHHLKITLKGQSLTLVVKIVRS